MHEDPSQRILTPAEWVVMKAVWQSQPVAAPTVQEILYPTRRWAYSTVRTLLDRMVAKGILGASKVRHMTLYSAILARKDAALNQLRQTLHHAFDDSPTALIQALLESHGSSPAVRDQIVSMAAIESVRPGSAHSATTESNPPAWPTTPSFPL